MLHEVADGRGAELLVGHRGGDVGVFAHVVSRVDAYVYTRRRAVAAVDEGYENEPGGGMDDALDDVEPEERQPPSDEEAEQDDYANTDDPDA